MKVKLRLETMAMVDERGPVDGELFSVDAAIVVDDGPIHCAWCGGAVPPLGTLGTDACIAVTPTGDEHFCSSSCYDRAQRDPDYRVGATAGDAVRMRVTFFRGQQVTGAQLRALAAMMRRVTL